jgi:hypothetical protein
MEKLKLVFDMDGTIYPLYEVNNWLERLLNEDVSIFTKKAFIGDILQFTKNVNLLKRKGYEIAICTWTPKNTSQEYVKRVELAKTEWIENFFGTDLFDEIFILPYGTPKGNCFQGQKNLVLFDDNSEVRKEWEEMTKCPAFDENYVFPVLKMLNQLG